MARVALDTMSLGWAALAIAFFAWLGEADGLLALPRPGRVAIRRGSFDIPFAFKVRRGERVLLFIRDEDPERGGWFSWYAHPRSWSSASQFLIRTRPPEVAASPSRKLSEALRAPSPVTSSNEVENVPSNGGS